MDQPCPRPAPAPSRIPGQLAPLLAVMLATAACTPPAARAARGLMDQGDYQGAEAAARQGLQAEPDHEELRRLEIEAVLAAGDAERAVSLYQAWYQRRGGHDRELLARLATQTLAQGLRVPSARVRAAAIQAIERLEIIPLARDVADRIEDDEDLVAAAAAIALLRSEPGAARVAGQLLRSDDPAARAVVIAGIARKLGEPTRGDVIAGLSDPHPAVRRAAIQALARMLAPGDAPRLIALAAGDPDPRARAWALRVLARQQGPRDAVLGAARRALADPHPGARLAAVALLERHGDVATLQALAATAEPALAVRAAMALRDRTPGLLGEAIQRGLADPAPDVRQAALNAAHALPAAVAGDLIQPHLADPSWGVRLAAARALLYLGETGADPAGSAAERARAVLVDALAQAPEPARAQAARDLLARLGDARGARALVALSKSPDMAVRQAVVRAYVPVRIRRAPDPALTLAVAAALADPAPLVRILAAEILLDGRDG